MAAEAASLKRRLAALAEETPDLKATHAAFEEATRVLKQRLDDAEKQEEERQTRVRHLDLMVQHLGLPREEAEKHHLEVEDNDGYWAEDGWSEYRSHFDDPDDITPYEVTVTLSGPGGLLAHAEAEQRFDADVGSSKVYFGNLRVSTAFRRIRNACPFSVAQVATLFEAACPRLKFAGIDYADSEARWYAECESEG